MPDDTELVGPSDITAVKEQYQKLHRKGIQQKLGKTEKADGSLGWFWFGRNASTRWLLGRTVSTSGASFVLLPRFSGNASTGRLLGGNASTSGASFILLPGFGGNVSTGRLLGRTVSTSGASFVLLPRFSGNASTRRLLGENAYTGGVSFVLLPRFGGNASTGQLLGGNASTSGASFILLPGCEQFCMHARAIIVGNVFIFLLSDWVCLVVRKGG